MRTAQEQREYDNLRRARRRKILKVALGGECVRCGDDQLEDLEFDHINPATKIFHIGRGILKPWWVLLQELTKCQLLCHRCHQLKSQQQSSVGHGEGFSGKRNCKCELCRARKREYMRNWKASKAA